MDPLNDLNACLEPLATRFQSEAEAIVNNRDFSDEYKMRTVGELQKSILIEMETARTDYYVSLEKEQAALLPKGRLALPTAEMTPQLLYTRDVLQAQWAMQDAKTILANFEEAIRVGNEIELRAFHAFASTAPAFQVKPVNHSERMQHGVMNIKLSELQKQAEEKLLGPAGMKARERLTEIERQLSDVQRKRLPQSMMLVKHSDFRGGKLSYSTGGESRFKRY